MIVHIVTSFRTVFVLFRTCSVPTQFGPQQHLFRQCKSMISSQDHFESGQYTSTIDGSHLEFQHEHVCNSASTCIMQLDSILENMRHVQPAQHDLSNAGVAVFLVTCICHVPLYQSKAHV